MSKMVNPVGETKQDDLRVGFDRRLKLRFVGSKVTEPLLPTVERLVADSKLAAHFFNWNSRFGLLQLAEVAVPRRLLVAIRDRIKLLTVPSPDASKCYG